MPEPKKQLTLDSSPKEMLNALCDASNLANSDLTQLIGRDLDDNLLFVAVYARGEDAEALEQWLNSAR